MTFVPLTTAEADAKSPIDDLLMGKIKADLDDLNSRVIAAGAAPFNLEVIGRLSFLNTYPNKRSIAGMVLSKEFTPSYCRFGLKRSGLSGSLTIDLRQHTSPKTPITGIDYLFSGATQSVGRAGASLATQSIARATPQIATQSITHAKAALNIQSIIGLGVVVNLGSNVWLYNLSAPLDSDTKVGDYILVASATSGGNNGLMQITDVGRGGGNNFTVENASGVAQSSAAGTAQPKIMAYNFTNPVSTMFGLNDLHLFSSHTNVLNDGQLAVYKINQSGNNIWVKNPNGVTQAGVAGNANTNYWSFNLAAAASTTDYVPLESVLTQGHSSAGNNITGARIQFVNSGGNNLILYIVGGSAQAGVAGTIDTYRWIYSMPTDPTGTVVAGNTIYFLSHSNAGNDGAFIIKEINRSGGNNIVVYNFSGVTQGGAAGITYSSLKVVKFASDQSAIYSIGDFVEMWQCAYKPYNANDTLSPIYVQAINKFGGANYNIVIDFDDALAPGQASPAGFIKTQMRSIFNSAPTLAASISSPPEADENIVGFSTDLKTTVISANTPIMLYIVNNMTGDPRDLTVSLL
jgi:hypothetical protein